MKKLFLFIALLTSWIGVNAQTHTNKDGSPDMRYKENREIYPTTPSPSYEPNYTPRETYPTRTTPSSTYPSTTDPYPTKQDGTPDMRYKSNRDLYPTTPR